MTRIELEKESGNEAQWDIETLLQSAVALSIYLSMESPPAKAKELEMKVKKEVQAKGGVGAVDKLIREKDPESGVLSDIEGLNFLR
jgi:hypothetical protein